MRTGQLCTYRAIGALVLAAALSPLASAALTDVVLTVEAQCGRSSGCVEITQEDGFGFWQGSTYYLIVDQPIPILGGGGEELGTFGPITVTSYTDPEIPGRGTPQVNLGFAMQAGTATTNFRVKSALLSFGPWANQTGKASVGFLVADTGSDGATLTGTGPAGGAYVAQYNGFVPDGATFAEGIQSVTAEPFSQGASDPFDTGWQPIAGSVGNMSSMISFSLSANDMATGTSNFQILPEPAPLLLLALGAFLARRR